MAKPHIGTDRLIGIIRNMREEIIRMGGSVLFEHRLCGIITSGSAIRGAAVEHNGIISELECDSLVLAIGHSARDTVKMLYESNISMEQKPYAMGVRIEHSRKAIDKSQYGKFAGHDKLSAADYKISCTPDGKRGVYSFCMCPGGVVVPAASEEGMLAVNGMSEFARDGENSNAALLVGVTPEDFGSAHPLAGIAFQRAIERAAFEAGGGTYSAPCQRVGDFLEQRATAEFGAVRPTYEPGVTPDNLYGVLPDFVCDSMAQGIRKMGRYLAGFDDPDALLTAPETRSSSPVRILRDERRECPTVRGLFPCGEGAGYAGGITSAAVDGLRCAEEILKQSRGDKND